MADKVRLKHPESGAERVSFDIPDKIKVWTDRGYRVVSEPETEADSDPVDLAAMTVPQLRDLAAEASIDLGEVRTKDEIVAAIAAAQNTEA